VTNWKNFARKRSQPNKVFRNLRGETKENHKIYNSEQQMTRPTLERASWEHTNRQLTILTAVHFQYLSSAGYNTVISDFASDRQVSSIYKT